MFTFSIQKKLQDKTGKEMLGRVATYATPHGEIKTPAFVTVGTKAAVKGVTVEMLRDINTQVFLANTYHLHIAPGEEIVKQAGGLHAFSNWDGPMMTDSGGFQAFSLGAAFGTNVSKIATKDSGYQQTEKNTRKDSMAKVTEEGVEFRSYKDGSKIFFTPEKSMQIQQDLGADMYFAFDECTSPQATAEYQKEAMDRTHRWAKRSLDEHQRLEKKKKSLMTKITDKVGVTRARSPQALFGVVQGGQHLDLRKESAQTLGAMDFDGYGIGGAFTKEDMAQAVHTACVELPENKPRHMLGIGEPIDFFLGIENGMDLFDCVAPTRMARHGSVHTKDGKQNIKNAKNRTDFGPIEKDCTCYACANYSRAYICHLLREKEMLGATLASVHNLAFVIKIVDDIRSAMLEDRYFEFKKNFLDRYHGKGSW